MRITLQERQANKSGDLIRALGTVRFFDMRWAHTVDLTGPIWRLRDKTIALCFNMRY